MICTPSLEKETHTLVKLHTIMVDGFIPSDILRRNQLWLIAYNSCKPDCLLVIQIALIKLLILIYICLIYYQPDNSDKQFVYKSKRYMLSRYEFCFWILLLFVYSFLSGNTVPCSYSLYYTYSCMNKFTSIMLFSHLPSAARVKSWTCLLV